jgi:hypothetical protein
MGMITVMWLAMLALASWKAALFIGLVMTAAVCTTEYRRRHGRSSSGRQIHPDVRGTGVSFRQ